MSTEIDGIRTAILQGAPGDEIGALPLPEATRGALVKADEQEMFAGLESADKDPRKSIHVEDFPLPEIAPDEAYVAVSLPIGVRADPTITEPGMAASLTR
jgi:crotonyl-CoA reductase